MAYFPRHLERIVKTASKQFSSILVTGARQVGKTTLLQHLYPNLPYISMDDPVILELGERDPNRLLKMNSLPMIIDEVQYAPSLFPYFKITIDRTKQKGLFYITGSQQFHMMKHVSESLAGRVAIVNLYGLSLREIQKIPFSQPFLPTNEYFTKREETLKEISYRQIWRLIQQGCMPSMYSHDTTWKLFYSSYTRTYIERDVHQLTTISNESSFLTFLMILASRTAQLLNLTSIANEVGISVNTAKRWLSILISSHIVYLLKPYSSNASKRLVKTPKLYFIDTGLAAYLTKWNNPEVLEAGASSGHFFETYVISEILKSYTNAGETDPPLYFYRDKDQKEIDLIIEENGVLHPIEIKKSASPNPGMINSFSVLQKFTTKQVGSGGVVCFYDSLLPIDEKNYIVPVQYL